MSDEIKLEELPGYREAIEREGELRSNAFIDDLPEFICGVAVLPLTLDHLNRLKAVRSPFVCKSVAPSPVEVALFLWCVSPDYRAAMRLRQWGEVLSMKIGAWLFNRKRRAFAQRVAKLDYVEAIEGIDAYLNEAFQDAPGSDGRGSFSAPFYSSQASLVMAISEGRGWGRSEVMNTPLKCVWQYLRLMQRKSDPKSLLFNPSDRLRREEVDKANARRSQN